MTDGQCCRLKGGGHEPRNNSPPTLSSTELKFCTLHPCARAVNTGIHIHGPCNRFTAQEREKLRAIFLFRDY